MARLEVDELLRELNDLPGSNGYPTVEKSLSSISQSVENARPSGLQNIRCSSSKNQQPNHPSSPHSPVRGIAHCGSVNGRQHNNSPLGSCGTPTSLQGSAPGSRGTVSSEVDELLNDLDIPMTRKTNRTESIVGVKSSLSQPSPLNNSSSTPRGRGQKCRGVFVGGSGLSRGRNGTSMNGDIVCCDSLRCTKCDLKVINFMDKKWSSRVDYLFFRNNYPTEKKLLPELSASGGSCAYCCQCSWIVSSSAECIDGFGGDLRWVCAGH